MKGGPQVAVALGAGYLLARRRKTRMTTMLAAAAAAGGLGLGGAALRRGVKTLGSSEAVGKVAPQLGEIADMVRGDLLTAGRAAAIAAVSNRIESLSDSLHERAELVRDPGAAAAGADEDARTGAGKAMRGARRRGRRAVGDEDASAPGDEKEPGSEEPDESEADEPEAAPRRRRSTGRPRSGGPEAVPARRRTTTRRQSPVVRRGR